MMKFKVIFATKNNDEWEIKSVKVKLDEDELVQDMINHFNSEGRILLEYKPLFKKVFRMWKLIDNHVKTKQSLSNLVDTIKSGWPLQCEGKEVINGKCGMFIVRDEWCVIEYED